MQVLINNDVNKWQFPVYAIHMYVFSCRENCIDVEEINYIQIYIFYIYVLHITY